MRTAQMDTELHELNCVVDSALARRRKWMDGHMDDYAKYRMGESLFELENGRLLGKVAGYYRCHAGDSRYDTSMSIHYRLDNGDNTSRLLIPYGNAIELQRRLEATISFAAFTKG